MYKKILNNFKRFLFTFCVNSLGSSVIVHPKARTLIYKISGINDNSKQVRSGCLFETSNVSIGQGSFINRNCHFASWENISIGKNVFIAMNVTLITGTHLIEGPEKRAGKEKNQPISIEDGCWVGGCVTILPGVTVRTGCVIAAGSVVTKDCEPNSLYAGVPARKIRELAV